MENITYIFPSVIVTVETWQELIVNQLRLSLNSESNILSEVYYICLVDKFTVFSCSSQHLSFYNCHCCQTQTKQKTFNKIIISSVVARLGSHQQPAHPSPCFSCQQVSGGTSLCPPSTPPSPCLGWGPPRSSTFLLNFSPKSLIYNAGLGRLDLVPFY